jgi:hypothetical protein
MGEEIFNTLHPISCKCIFYSIETRPVSIFHEAHENPELPQDDPPMLVPLPENPPTLEIFRSVSFEPQSGQGGDIFLLIETSSSNSFPHFLHLYS